MWSWSVCLPNRRSGLTTYAVSRAMPISQSRHKIDPVQSVSQSRGRLTRASTGLSLRFSNRGARRIAADEHTGAIARIQALSTALLQPWREGLPHLGELRYQLLTGIAGTIGWAGAIGASRAVHRA
jgi:hypothetical protein